MGAPAGAAHLRACGQLEQGAADDMAGWDHGGGFSLDATVRIEGADRAGRVRLLRYCARPPFALDPLRQHDAAPLLYDIAKPRPDGPRALVLTPLELIDQITALVPLARIDETLPLTCPFCHASLRIIAFINDASAVRQILDHLGEATRPPRIAPPRADRHLWEAATIAAASNDLACDHTFPPPPALEFDQRITW